MANADQSVLAHVPRAWQGRWPGGLLIILVSAIAFLPGLNALPPVDRDEARFAQASRQMAQSGTMSGWVVPMVGDRPRLNKPPLSYWLQAVSATLLLGPDLDDAKPGLPTGGIWAFRIPSVICATLAALLTWRLGLAMFGQRQARSALLAGILLACSVMVMWDARQARADQLLLASTTAATLALWRCWRAAASDSRADRAGPPPRAPWRSVVPLWCLCALGILSKGPITPKILLLTAVALSAPTGRWRWMFALRPFSGICILAAIVAPWVLLVASEVGWDRYLSIVTDEVLGRSVSAREGHWGPPGYHTLLLPALFWPGSLLTAAGITIAWKRIRMRASTRPNENGESRTSGWLSRFHAQAPAELFLLAWLVPSWMVFEFVGTKLPHYMMPLYPAIALLSARAITLAGVAPEAPRALGLARTGTRVGFVVWIVLGIAIAVLAPIGLSRFASLSAPPGTMLALGALVGAAGGMIIAAGRALWTARFPLAQALGIGASLLTSLSVCWLVLPNLSDLWLSSRLMLALDDADSAHTTPIGALGYHEDSLQFLSSARIQRLSAQSLAPWLHDRAGAIVIAPWPIAEPARSSLGGATEVARISGFNFSKGDWVTLVVLRAP